MAQTAAQPACSVSGESNQLGDIMWQGSYEFIVNQWGVGHGGFHSQSLLFQRHVRLPTTTLGDGSLVQVIYDCGSGRKDQTRPALKSAVSRMLNDVTVGSTIDLLVISHFDNDHVNGLEFLAEELDKKNIQVDRVWVPMLGKIEALYAIATSNLEGDELQAYAALVYDPVGQLTELFDGAEVTPIPPNGEPIPLPPSDPVTSDDEDITLTTLPGQHGLVATSSATTAGEILWELQPYVIESTLAGAKTVAASVKTLLGKQAEKCSLPDLMKLVNDPSLLAAFHTAVQDHHKQINRGAKTSSARTGANLSSLCVYSGPVSPYEWCRFRGGWNSPSATPRAIPIAPAWLGTGDAGLLRSKHVDAMRTVLTQSRLDRVGVTSAPHHGSRLDSGAELWDALPNVRWVTIEANNLVGGSGNYHPHTQVLTELATRNLTVHTSIDNNDFYWRDKRIR
ncbi:MBL fold metallo-hydrolase [Arthrobacter sp. TMN-49]